MDTIIELKQERRRLIGRMREILDGAEAESRDLSAEESQEYERLETDVDALGKRAKRLEDQEALELRALEREERFDPRDAQGDTAAAEASQRAAEYAEVFELYVRYGATELDREQRKILAGGGVEMRDQAKGTNSAGGFLVPTEFERRLQEHLVQAGAMRASRATIIRTSGGEDLQIPKTVSHGAATLVATEGTALSSADESFGQVTLNAFTYARMIKVSEQLLADSAVDLVGYLAREIGRSIGALQNSHFVNGTGTGQPLGVIPATSVGKTGAAGQVSTIIYDDVVDLIHSVGVPYRREGEFLANDGIIKALRKLKDSTGHPLWEPSLQAGEPDRLLGYPVLNDPDVPAPAANAKSLVFGDLSAYWIRDVGSVAVRRLDERFADALQVGFLAWMRADGDLVDTTTAVRVYQHPAA